MMVVQLRKLTWRKPLPNQLLGWCKKPGRNRQVCSMTPTPELLLQHKSRSLLLEVDKSPSNLPPALERGLDWLSGTKRRMFMMFVPRSG
jgi:hypothetical protein